MTLIASLLTRLGLESSSFSSGVRKSRRELSGLEKQAQGAKRMIAGLFAGATLASFVAVAKRGLEAAAAIGEVAQQVGVSTKTLQAYRFIGSQVNITHQEMERGLGEITRRMGEAQAPGSRLGKLFKALGVDVTDANGKVREAGEVIPELADAWNRLPDAARQSAVAADVFSTKMGRKFQSMLALGSAGINNLRQEAERLGLVLSDDQIQKADKTADKLDELKQVLEARIAGVVSENANAILGFATSLATLTSKLAEFWQQNPQAAMALIGTATGAAVGSRLGPVGATAGAGAGFLVGGLLGELAQTERAKLEREKKGIEQEIARTVRIGPGSTLFNWKRGPANPVGSNSRTDLDARLARINHRLGAIDKEEQATSLALGARSPGGTLNVDAAGGGKEKRRTDEEVYEAFLGELRKRGLNPTSGKRSTAEQAALYAKLGPGNAAPPGSSDHEFWKAFDFGPNVDRKKLAEAAAAAGVRLGPELVHGKKRHLHQTFEDAEGKGGGEEALAKLAEEERQRREEALREAHAFDTEKRSNDIAILGAERELAADYVERTAISKQILDKEFEQERAGLQLAVDLGEISEGKAAELLKQRERLHDLDVQQLLLDQEIARQQDWNRLEELNVDIRRDALDAEARRAETAAERRAVELRLLDLAYEEERDRIRRLKESRDWADQEEGRRREAALDGRYNSDKDEVLRGTRGPLESYLKSLPDTAAKMNEALEHVAADGLGSMIDGLAEASAGWIKMGGIAGDILRQIYTSLMRVLIARLVAETAGNAIMSAIGSSGYMPGASSQMPVLQPGGIFSSIPSSGDLSSIPRLAGGGEGVLGGRGGTDRNLLSLNGAPLAWVSKDETMRISPKNDNRNGNPVNIDLRGAVMTQDLLAQMQRMAAQSGGVATVSGAALAQSRMLFKAGRQLP